ncbi:FAD-dependent oxidoreductase, partial [Candidatus Woesearchaeota archaeon]|nr:FAD-dependent oxidoreductase [Candidatus Woesearchaeota archaeon]
HNIVAAQRGRTLRNSHTEVEKALRILIIGGGTVGVELAGELVTKYPKKDIVIVHSRDSLMQRSCEPVKRHAEKWLRKLGVEIHLNERVLETHRKTFQTDKGKHIRADLAFLCTGIIPNTEFLKKSFPDAVDKKCLLVDEYLRLQGSHHIFVGGDITNIPEEKLAQNAEKHAELIVDNICREHMGKTLCAYKTKQRPMIISLGKWHGMFTYKNICVHGLIPAFLKSFVEWRTMKRYKRGA